MNSINNVENVLDEYYNVLCERNDSNRVVITPEYIDSHLQQLEDVVRLFTLYPDYLIDIITPKDSFFRLYFYQRKLLRVWMR